MVFGAKPGRTSFLIEVAHLRAAEHRLEYLDILGVAQLGGFHVADLLLNLGNPVPMRLDNLILLLMNHQVRQLELFVHMSNL